MDDDFNTPVVLANVFEAVRLVNMVNDHTAEATEEDLKNLRVVFDTFVVDVLGLRMEASEAAGTALKPYEDAVNLLLEMRSDAKKNKNWALSDLIRDRLGEIGFSVKDTKDGYEWSLKGE
jgi:cysteinyl-tRNA synthetase